MYGEVMSTRGEHVVHFVCMPLDGVTTNVYMYASHTKISPQTIVDLEQVQMGYVVYPSVSGGVM